MHDQPIKVLITGASGFIGSHLLQLLLARGYSVVCVVRDPLQLVTTEIPSARLEVIKGDLNLESTMQQLPPAIDVVIHLAALLGDAEAEGQELTKSNVEMTGRLLQWFSLSEGKQFIFVSTPGVQGLGHRTARESDPYNPAGLYEKTKMLSEVRLQNYPVRPQQYWTIVRPDFVYGPGDTRRIRLYRKIRKRQWIKIGKGDAVVRPTYVLDVCEALLLCINNPMAFSRIFNVAGPELVSVDSFINTIARLLDVRLFPVRLPTAAFRAAAAILEPLARWTGSQSVFTQSQVSFLTRDHGTDISEIKKQLGFCPKTSFEEGMGRTLRWAKEVSLL